MKIVCDNCATKYSIADEKVRGKVFKIRCKKCSHIIVVKGTEGDAGVDAGPADAAPAEADAGDGWHVVINGEQVGPLSVTEVRSKFSAGEIDAETFAWKEGFGDWQRLASIDDFRDLQAAPAPEMTRRSGAPVADDLFGGGAATSNNDLFGTPGGDLFAGSSEPAPAAGAALFAQPTAEASRRSPTPGFGTPAAEPAAPMQAAPVAASGSGKALTGQRNENSVLFSLNNLQALASGGPANKPSAAAAPSSSGVENRPGFANSQTEGSGLIDIRAMAAATLSSPSQSSSSHNDIPSYSSAPVFSPIAAPILLPTAASGPPRWLWPVVGLGGLVIIVFTVAIVVLVTRKPEPVAAAPVPVVAPAPVVASAAPAAVAPAAVPAPTAGTPAAAATPTAAATPAAATDKHSSKNASKAGRNDKLSGTKVAKNDVPAPADPAPVAAPAPTPKKRSGGGDDLDALLNNASPDKPKASHESAAASSSDDNLPDQLDKSAIVGGMGSVKPRVNDCYHQFNVPGIANVAVTIVKSGHISSANVTGALAGTPTGDCVAKAVKSASFPKFKGAPQSITYPFMLR